MQLKETLKLIGFPLPSDNKLKIFCGQIYKMLNREKEHTMDIVHDMDEEELLEEWDVLFSPQYTFVSFMMIKAPDRSTTEQYKNNQREQV